MDWAAQDVCAYEGFGEAVGGATRSGDAASNADGPPTSSSSDSDASDERRAAVWT